jgi:hypothetical protein
MNVSGFIADSYDFYQPDLFFGVLPAVFCKRPGETKLLVKRPAYRRQAQQRLDGGGRPTKAENFEKKLLFVLIQKVTKKSRQNS